MHADDAPSTPCAPGARGYLLKSAEREVIARAGLTVAAGRNGLRRRRRPSHPRLRGSPTRPEGKLFPELSDREHEVLEYLARGLGNHEIAAHLILSEKTVRNHLATILVKLQVRDRAAAVARARDRVLR